METQAEDSPRFNPGLLALNSWLLWRNTEGRKQPYYITGSPRSGTLDTPRDISRLASYADATRVLADHPRRYAGLGLAINDGLQFIDLDDVRDPETGDVKAWVRPILERAIAMGAYVEVSVSGRGFHIIGRGIALESVKTKAVEIYTHGRFCAMGTPIATGAEDLPELGPLMALLAPVMEDERPGLKLVHDASASVTPVPSHTSLLWPEHRDTIIKSLAKLDPDMGYGDWLRVGMVIHRASRGAPDGLTLWESWSVKGSKYKPGDCAKRWGGFRLDKATNVTMGTLVRMAREATLTRSRTPENLPTRFTLAELEALSLPATRWLVEGFLPPGLTLIAAPPKTGKSYFVLQLGMCLSAGIPFLGMAATKCRVLYLNLEEWHQLLTKRVLPIRAHMSLGPEDVPIEFDIATPEDPIGYAQEQFDLGIDVLVVDIFARVRDEMSEDTKAGVYARDYAAMEKWADVALANPGKSVVMVHHANKGLHEAWQNRISGSNGIAGATHTNIVMSHLDTRGLEDEAKPKVRRYRKLFASGKEVQELELLITQLDDGGGWAVATETEDDVRSAHRQDQVLAVLRGAPDKWVEGKLLIRLLEGSDDLSRGRLTSWYRVLKRMVSRGLILSGGSGGKGYTLPPTGHGR